MGLRKYRWAMAYVCIFLILDKYLLTPPANFRLNNMLYVPDISTNLISVHHFTTEDNCIFIFDSFDFCIKDKAAGKKLF